MARSTSIIGLVKLERKLKRLPAAALDAIRATMETAADDIVAMMKSLVPVDSGALRDSIGWTWGKAPKGAMVLATVKATTAGQLTLTIFAGRRDKSLGDADAYYVRWVEFGTVKMPAQPFFFVSWRANRKPAKRKISAAVRKSAKAVARGG